MALFLLDRPQMVECRFCGAPWTFRGEETWVMDSLSAPHEVGCKSERVSQLMLIPWEEA